MASASATGHIEKCGYLKIKRPPSSGKVRFKAWQSKYFVLRDLPPIFEYFKDELSYHVTRSNKERNRINLENIIHIGTTDASKTQRNAFMIVDSQHGALMLASESEQDTKEWIEALNRVAIKNMSPNECPDLGSIVYPDQSPPLPGRRSVSNASPLSSPVLVDAGLRRASAPPTGGGNNQGFLVTTRLTPSSEKNGIRDSYIMQVTDDHVVLHRLDSNASVISWPIIGLRGWKSEPAESAGRRSTRLLTLESGRKSTTGEGLFQFFTHFGDQIAAKIRAHSKVLCASAVHKREKFKHDRSNSFEDLANSCSGEEIIKKALTDPRSSVGASGFTMSSLAESDSLLNVDKTERPKLSPTSLRKELLQGMCSKDVNTKEIKEFDSSPAEECDVFSAQPTDNAYLDLICESGVGPIHISDPESRRTSTNSEEGLLISKSQIPSIDESNEQTDYIDESEIYIYSSEEKHVNLIKGRRSQSQDDDVPYSEPTVSRSSDTAKQAQGVPDTRFCQDFFDQLSNPTAHKASIFPQHQSQLKPSHPISNSDNPESDHKGTEVSSDTILTSADLIGKPSRVLSDVTNSIVTCQGDVSDNTDGTNQSNGEFAANKIDPGLERYNSEELSMEGIVLSSYIEVAEESVDKSYSDLERQENFHKLLKRSDETQDLLQKCLFQLESPQTFAQQDLFPHFPKRNSTGNVATDKMNFKKTNDGKLKVKSLTISELGTKKIIEKSKSHIGFNIKPSVEMPPPLPARKEMDHGRARNSCSMGDIFEDIQRRPEQFPKGINRQLSPIGTHTPGFGASCGPQSLVTARLLQRTTSGSNLVAFDKRSFTHISINDSKIELQSSTSEINRPRSSSFRSSRYSASQSCEDDKSTDSEGEGSKGRRGSKASKLLNKVLNNFSLSPVITTKRRASCDSLSPDALKGVETLARRGSAANTGIDNEGWSPESSLDVPTPEGSPKLFRKSSSALRRASHDPSLGRKYFFVGSPTFDNRNEELKQKARERERERAALPHQPPPALPPRKKSDPPPLPPRRKTSCGDNSCPSSPPSRTESHEHSSSSTINTISPRASLLRGSGSSYDDQTSPPPIPPRREERRGSQPPAIQLTVSSPENKTVDNSLDGLPEEPSSNSPVEGAPTLGRHSPEVPMQVARPPTISSTLSIDTDVSCPVPKRPLKNKEQWSRQRSVDMLDLASPDEEISGPRDLSYERKPVERCPDSVGGTSKLQKMESAFVSIGIGQERARQSHEKMEVSEIELDSLTCIFQSESKSVNSQADKTDCLTPPLHSVATGLGSKGTSGRCSPGHSPPLSLNVPKRGSGLLGDSGSTTPISV